MRIQDSLYFAPGFLLMRLADASSRDIVDAFESRINEYYFSAAEILNSKGLAFGSGAICFDAVDAIAKYEFKEGQVGVRFKKWISKLPAFKNFTPDALENVYNDFRNGVTHEARIKNGGQFTYEVGGAVHMQEGVVMINPNRLLEQIRVEFTGLMERLRHDSDALEMFANAIKSNFRVDLEKLERIHS